MFFLFMFKELPLTFNFWWYMVRRLAFVRKCSCSVWLRKCSKIRLKLFSCDKNIFAFDENKWLQDAWSPGTHCTVTKLS